MIEMKDTAKGVRFIVKVVTRGLFCQKAVVKNFANWLENICDGDSILVWLKFYTSNHSSSTYAKFAEKLTLMRTCTRAYQGERNNSFLENFAYVLS